MRLWNKPPTLREAVVLARTVRTLLGGRIIGIGAPAAFEGPEMPVFLFRWGPPEALHDGLARALGMTACLERTGHRTVLRNGEVNHHKDWRWRFVPTGGKTWEQQMVGHPNQHEGFPGRLDRPRGPRTGYYPGMNGETPRAAQRRVLEGAREVRRTRGLSVEEGA